MPVPAKDQIRIICNNKSIYGQKASIYSASGIEMKEIVLQPVMHLDLTMWPAGSYVLLTSKGKCRFIKL